MQLHNLVDGILVPLTTEQEAQFPIGWPCRQVSDKNGKSGLVPLTQQEADGRTAAAAAWTAGEAARAAQTARVAADESDRVACKIDAAIMALVNQTRSEWRAWAGTNFPSLTAAERTRLGDLFWVVSIGVRTRVRNGG